MTRAMDQDYIENVSASLVREYLSRKGLRCTLAAMDEEAPRVDGSISNRQALMKALHIEKLLKKNKEQNQPYKAMIEVMANHFMNSELASPDNLSMDRQRATKPNDITTGCAKTVKKSDVTSDLLMDTKKAKQTDPKILSSYLQIKSMKAQQARGNTRDKEDLVVEDSLDGETILGDGKAGLLTQANNLDTIMNAPGGRPKSSRVRGMSGPITSNLDSRDKRRIGRNNVARPTSRLSNFRLDYDPSTNEADNFMNRGYSGASLDLNRDPDNGIQTCTPSTGRSDSSGSNASPVSSGRNTDDGIQDILSVGRQTQRPGLARIGRTSSSEKEDINLEPEPYDVKKSSISNGRRPSRTGNDKVKRDRVNNMFGSKPKTNLPASVRVGDVEIGDLDDLENDLADFDIAPSVPFKPPVMVTDSKPIDVQTAVELKKLIFGTASQSFSDEWRLQSFSFCDLPGLQYGIVQKKGGPCGVLASVQACMLQELLFSDGRRPTQKSLEPSRIARSEALAQALSTIFWRAGDCQRAVVALPGGKSHFPNSSRCKADGLTERLVLNNFRKYEDLVSFMKQQISSFEMDGSSGVILALYSAILSRTIRRVTSDMDEPTNKLMGAHGYCTQDMVNLLLTGQASSNVFNDVMELDSGHGQITVLKGINSRCDIGLLSLFEHYKSCQVGTYLKTPKYPIWVVCSESHFSVLFSLKRELISDWKAERRFDLYYYDGLARQDEEIRLTIDSTDRFFEPPSEDELVPPLEHCIRTKWPAAEVDWNDSEPIL